MADGEGRGAWTTRGKDNGSVYYALVPGTSASEYDGANPDVSQWHNRVRRGVRAIDKLLSLAGRPSEVGKVRYVFDEDMSSRVMHFQEANGINPSGYVGGITMRHLVAPHVESIYIAQNVHPRWGWGLITKESAFDSGAQGFFHAPDSGLCQFNTEATEVTLDEAYNPTASIRMAARRFAAARDACLAEHPGERVLAINVALAQHNSPVWSDEWKNSGSAPNPTIAEYVSLTRDFAKEWKTFSQ